MDHSRWTYSISLASFLLFCLSGIFFVVWLTFSARQPGIVLDLAVMALIVSLTLRVILFIARRLRRVHEGGPDEAFREHACHRCGYNLTGVQGINCPECGTVREARDD